MRRRKMQILHLRRRTSKPTLLPHIRILLLHRNRRRAEQRPVATVERKGNQIISIRLVEQLHLPVCVFLRKVLALNRGIVNRVREGTHIPEIISQIFRHPVQKLGAALGEKLLRVPRENAVQPNAEQGRDAHRDRRKGNHDNKAYGARYSEKVQQSHASLPRLSLYLLGDIPNCFLKT